MNKDAFVDPFTIKKTSWLSRPLCGGHLPSGSALTTQKTSLSSGEDAPEWRFMDKECGWARNDRVNSLCKQNQKWKSYI